VNSSAQLDRSFLALSHPARRAIVEKLAQGPATVGAASAGLGLSKPAVSKHVRVLEDAGLVRRDVNGREHRLRLDGRSMTEAEQWIERHRELWEQKFEAVERYLQEGGRT
jgi:DNA-binding transcriptional ArsR family regulator